MDQTPPPATAPRRRDPRYERWRWRVFAVTWLAYFGFYLTRKSFAVAKIGMGDDPLLGSINYDAATMASRTDRHVGLTDGDMSAIDGAYLTAYAVGQFIWGIAGDRLGPRWVVLVGLLGSVTAAVLMGASSLTVTLGLFFALQGLFQATGWAPLAKNVGSFFSQHERGVVFGVWSTNYAVGGLVASVFAGWWGDQYGWRYAFYAPAAALLVVAALFWLFQANRPEDVGLEPIEAYHGEPTPLPPGGEHAAAEPEGSWKAAWGVITNPTVLLLGLVYFLLKPTRYAILFWSPKYVNAKLGTNMTGSGLMGGLFELAGIGSTLLAGVASDRLFGSRRMPVCVICLLALGAFLFVFDGLPANAWLLGGGFLLIGFLLFAPDSILSGAAAADFGTKRGTSTAAGWVNGCGSVGAVVGGTIPGLLVERWGWSGVFSFLASLVLLAGLVLSPKWNAMPPARAQDA